MQEIWKDVIGYEGYYKVSNLGNVMQCEVYTNLNGKPYTRHEKIKKQSERGGYLCVGLSKDGISKTYFVHQLVAKAFIPNDKPDVFNCVNHKDEDKKNNRVDNLEWCDRAYNDNYGTRNERLSISGKKWHLNNKELYHQRCKDNAKCGELNPFYGKHHTQKTRDLISHTLKEGYASGRLVSPMKGVHRYGEDAPRYGAKLSDETKKKISESMRGFKHTDEAKRKMSASGKGRVFVNDGVHNRKVKLEELQLYLDMGYVKGRLTPWQ